MITHVPADCGNAPKRVFIKDLKIAFAERDSSFLLDRVTDHIVWNIVGERAITGKENILAYLEELNQFPVAELRLDSILSHGREGAAQGLMKIESGTWYGFSDFYQFSSAKGDAVKTITSYLIKLNHQS